MKKTFTIGENSLGRLIQEKTKAIKLFALITIAGTSFANAQTLSNAAAESEAAKGQMEINERNSGGQNNPIRNVTITPICPSITSLSMVDKGYNKILVEWSNMMNFDSILFQFQPSGSGNSRVVSIVGNPNPGSYFIQGLLSQTTYDIQVATVCNGARSAWSSPLTVTTLIEPGPRLSGSSTVNARKVYFVPNPASNQTKLKFISARDNELYDINILAPAGNIVYTTQVVASSGVNEIQLDLFNYLPGLYIAKVSTSNDMYVEKLIVN